MKNKKTQIEIFRKGDLVQFTDEDGSTVVKVKIVEGPYRYPFNPRKPNLLEEAYTICHEKTGSLKIIEAAHLSLATIVPTLLEAAKRALDVLEAIHAYPEHDDALSGLRAAIAAEEAK